MNTKHIAPTFALLLVSAIAAFSFMSDWNVYCYTEKKWIGGTGFTTEQKAKDYAKDHQQNYRTDTDSHLSAARRCDQSNKFCSD